MLSQVNPRVLIAPEAGVLCICSPFGHVTSTPVRTAPDQNVSKKVSLRNGSIEQPSLNVNSRNTRDERSDSYNEALVNARIERKKRYSRFNVLQLSHKAS